MSPLRAASRGCRQINCCIFRAISRYCVYDRHNFCVDAAAGGGREGGFGWCVGVNRIRNHNNCIYFARIVVDRRLTEGTTPADNIKIDAQTVHILFHIFCGDTSLDVCVYFLSNDRRDDVFQRRKLSPAHLFGRRVAQWRPAEMVTS